MIVALVGQPNSGKSTIFAAISGVNVRTGNFPGTTVSYTEAEVLHRGRRIKIVDLPGVYSLHAGDVAERVTLEYLLNEKVDVVVNVIDASVLSRSLELTIELAELQIPMLIVLNMMDEARRKGLEINTSCIEEAFGVPVVETIAHRGIGLNKLLDKILEARVPKLPRYSSEVEEVFAKFGISKRDLVLSLSESEFGRELAKFGDPEEVMSDERHKLAMRIFERCARVTRRMTDWREKVDALLLHPVPGYVIMAIIFLLMLGTAFFAGDLLSSTIVEPLEEFGEFFDGEDIVSTILRGVWDGVIGVLGIVVPYMLPLLLILGLLDDIGYLARAAFLLDRLFHVMGLHGKAAVSFILGYGCSVPAVMSTRILENPFDRVRAAILVPLIPCSARSVVILALVAGLFGPIYAIALYAFNVLVVALAGTLLTRIVGGESYGLAMEIPSLKVPSLRVVWFKVLATLREFTFNAAPLIIVGSVIFSLLSAAGVEGAINMMLRPVTGILGLPAVLGFTLIFGILRKELALLMTLEALKIDARELQKILEILSPCQIITYVVFLTLYVPCLSTIAVMLREIGARNTALAVAFSFLIALLTALTVRILCQAPLLWNVVP
ncbi:MAG: ferrous iron transport protein B [Archaeoglobaceae archaeon]